jgi:putative solute:sodium symporter small subunit
MIARRTAAIRGGAAHRRVDRLSPHIHRRISASGYSKREGSLPMAQQKSNSTTSDNDLAHWRKTTNLMWIHLGIWFFFGFIIHMFAPQLNKIVIAGFPLGFYMAAQGSLIVFVVQLFVFAKQQDNIDREFGVAEDD